MIAGRMRHRDSAGHEGLLSNGGVQWMTAGRGVIHSELPEQEDGRMEGFQLWLNLPAKDKMRAPWYRDIQSRARFRSSRRPEGVKVRVIAGRSHGVDGAMQRERDRAAVSRPRAAGGRSASRRRCRRRTTRSSTSIAAELRIGDTRGAGAADGDPRERAGSDGVVLRAEAADARAADRRQAARRADRAVRSVRDEHERRDLPGGAGFQSGSSRPHASLADSDNSLDSSAARGRDRERATQHGGAGPARAPPASSASRRGNVGGSVIHLARVFLCRRDAASACSGDSGSKS